jgi:hypothetical protein
MMVPPLCGGSCEHPDMGSGDPLWQTLIQAGERLEGNGRTTFTRAELLRGAHDLDPDHTDASWGPILQGMTLGATGGPPSLCGICFRRVGRGVYELLPATERQKLTDGAAKVPYHIRASSRRPAAMQERLADLVDDFDGCASAYDAAVPFRRSQQYRLHRQTIDMRRALGLTAALRDQHFGDLLYATLRAWGIGIRASRLIPVDGFRHALLAEEEALASLALAALEQLQEPSSTAAQIWALIERIGVVENDAQLVAGTKTLHHLLPDLVPPMDRRWTGQFFGWSTVRAQYQQQAIFLEAFTACADVARFVRPSRLVGEGWRTSQSKIVDNAIVGYCIANEAVHG